MTMHAPIARPRMRLLVRVTPKPGVSGPRLQGVYDLVGGVLSLLPVDERYRPVRNVWSEAELAILREHWPAGGIPACLPLLPGRDRKAIQNKAFRLGLKKRAAEPPAVSIGVRTTPLRLDPRPGAQPAAHALARAPREPVPASWVERQQARFAQARAFLASKGMKVTPVDRDSPLSGWWLSSYPDPLSVEQLIGIAETRGMA